MLRQPCQPRANWQKTVESQGMYYHTAGGVPYWDESACYRFTASEIDVLEAATYALDKMCLAAVQHVLDHDLWDRFLIPEPYRDFIRRSWDQDEHTIYGRFDLAFDGQSPPKLLEYNADTPTALLEAAVIQWFWLKDCFPETEKGDRVPSGCHLPERPGGGPPGTDRRLVAGVAQMGTVPFFPPQQFNSIHERLLEIFRTLRGETGERFYFTALAGCLEDYMTVSYLRDVAMQAGFDTAYLDVEQIGWHAGRRVFTDPRESAIRLCFKLYPWEWMQRDAFAGHLPDAGCRWFEPPWKALLSNKAILAVLWELYPESPYLLETSLEPLAGGDYVKKPILGREGANIHIFEHGKLFLQTPGPYDGPAVYQVLWPLPRFEGKYFPVVGSWIVNGWACGIGIREDENLITGNLSRFVPHVFE